MYILDNGKFKEGIIFWDTHANKNLDVDIFFYIHDYDKRGKYAYGFKTLEINLDLTVNEIFSQYKTILRNNIRQAEKKGFDTQFKTTINNDEIEEYVNLYNSFAEFKNLQKTNIEFIKELVNDKKLVISYSFYNKEIITIHSYYVDKARARLYHSFSTNNNLTSQENGLSNKYLIHNDILFFKNQNYKKYDFGGIGNVEGDNKKFEGIIKFKKQFGGQEIILWKGVTPNGKNGESVYDKYWK